MITPGSARHVAAGGVRFHLYRSDPPAAGDAGAAESTPVLLLHGVPETASCWRHLVPELARDRVVLAPDLPGLGASEIAGPYDVPTLVRKLAALVLHEVDGPVDVVGHDWGGSLALALAGARPELVNRLVVLNAPYRRLDYLHAAHVPLFSLPVLPEVLFATGRTRAVRAMIALGWRSRPPLDRAVLASYAAAYDDPARIRAMLGYYRALTRARLRALPRRLGRRIPPGPPRAAAPALVVWGALDPVLTLAVGEAVVRDLGAGTEFVVVPSAGHFPVEERPDVVVPVVAEFLRRAPAAQERTRADAPEPERADRGAANAGRP